MPVLSGHKWVDPSITWSLIPDNTPTPFGTSWLYRHLRLITGAPQRWIDGIASAFAEWQRHAAIAFAQVVDDGSPQGGEGRIQGDPRFGDIRIGTIEGGGFLCNTYYPGADGGVPNTTSSGDILLSSQCQEHMNGDPYDLVTLLLHEIGHAIGLAHSPDPSAVMFQSYPGVRRLLTLDDIAGVQMIYGPPA